MASKRQPSASLFAQARDAARKEAAPTGVDGVALACTGCSFIELSGEQDLCTTLLTSLGFRQLATTRRAALFTGNGMSCLLRPDPQRPTPSISGLGLKVLDAPRLLTRLEQSGMRRMMTTPEPLLNINIPAIHGPAGQQLYLVDEFGEDLLYHSDFGIERSNELPAPDRVAALPGLVFCLQPGKAIYWAYWFRHAMGMEQGIIDSEFTRRQGLAGFRLTDATARMRLILLEPRLPAGAWLVRHLDRYGAGIRLLGLRSAQAPDSVSASGQDLLQTIAETGSSRFLYFAAGNLVLEIQDKNADSDGDDDAVDNSLSALRQGLVQ